MKKDPEQALFALRDEAWKVFPFDRPDCCIVATRIGIEVLKRFGVAGHPTEVEAIALSLPHVAWVRGGRKGEPPEDAFFVAISTEPTPGKYGGHLVITGRTRGQAFLLDLTAKQFHRAYKNINVEDAVLLFRPPGAPSAFGWYEGPKGTAIGYLPHPRNDRAYRSAPDWWWPDPRREKYQEITDQLTAAVEARLRNGQ